MIAIHTTAISLPSEGKTSGSCCPQKVSSDHNTGQITLKFHFYAVWVFVNSLISQSNNNHFKNTTVVHFSAFVDLATEISTILPLWRLKLSVYFHIGEYYWKDFSSPAKVAV